MLKEVLFMYIILIPYRGASGGFHLKTHLGCILGTTAFYCGNVLLSQHVILDDITKYILIGINWIFGMFMIKLYAPADTENVPILSKKDRKNQSTLSDAIPRKDSRSCCKAVWSSVMSTYEKAVSPNT